MDYLEDYLRTRSYHLNVNHPVSDTSITLTDIFNQKDIIITRAYISAEYLAVVIYQDEWKRLLFDLNTGMALHYPLKRPDPQKDPIFNIIWSLYEFRPTRTALCSIKKLFL